MGSSLILVGLGRTGLTVIATGIRLRIGIRIRLRVRFGIRFGRCCLRYIDAGSRISTVDRLGGLKAYATVYPTGRNRGLSGTTEGGADCTGAALKDIGVIIERGNLTDIEVGRDGDIAAKEPNLLLVNCGGDVIRLVLLLTVGIAILIHETEVDGVETTICTA